MTDTTTETTPDRVRRLVLEVLAPTEYGHLLPSQVDVWDGYEKLVSIKIATRASLYYEMRKSTLRHGDHHLRGVLRTAFRARGVTFP